MFEGYIKIDIEDYYSFALSLSDGSRFFINDKEVRNNDGLHWSDRYRSYLVPLQKGFYPFSAEYFQRTGSRYFDLNIHLSPNF